MTSRNQAKATLRKQRVCLGHKVQGLTQELISLYEMGVLLGIFPTDPSLEKQPLSVKAHLSPLVHNMDHHMIPENKVHESGTEEGNDTGF